MGDHGFHLGQFGMPFDMRTHYDFDLRIPLVVSGPGIPKNVTNPTPVVSLDFAPTFLDMAGIRVEDDDLSGQNVDGKSFLESIKDESIDKSNFSRVFLVEYEGEGRHYHIDEGCSQYDTGEFYGCYTDFGCKCVDVKNNTYDCVRTLSTTENSIYCKFETNSRGIYNYEMYNLTADPFQLDNILIEVEKWADRESRENFHIYNAGLEFLKKCAGSSCNLGDTDFEKIVIYEVYYILPGSSHFRSFFAAFVLAAVFSSFYVAFRKYRSSRHRFV